MTIRYGTDTASGILVRNPLVGGQEQERNVWTTAAVMTNQLAIFRISGGPIRIDDLIAVCETANNATASTLQWREVPTNGSTQTISAASTTLANAGIGTTVRIGQASLSTVPLIGDAATAGGVVVTSNTNIKFVLQPGDIQIVIGVGSTTGTWRHHLRYTPLSAYSQVIALF